MAKNDLDSVLFRIDPAQNMARFYAISIQPNLFGGQSLHRNWGRIGSVGRLRYELLDDADSSSEAEGILVQTKTMRGHITMASLR